MNTIATLKGRKLAPAISAFISTYSVIFLAGSGQAQVLDTNYHPNVGQPAAVAIQPDGRVLVGGYQTFHRLRSDGSLDTLLPGLFPPPSAFIVEPDGQITVGGDGYGYSIFGRTNPDGPVNPIDVFMEGGIYAMALQPDGKILAAGWGNGPSLTNRIVRVNSDGTLDTNFNAFASYTVFNLTVQPDGKILVGGFFGLLNGQLPQIIGRLNTNGTVDTNFNGGYIGHLNGSVQTMLLQPDGKILIGGYFTAVEGQTRKLVARLNSDGTLDSSFNAGEASGGGNNVNSLALQSNGKIVVGGDFTTLGGHACTNLGRLNPDGSFDASFEGSIFFVNGMALQPDGSLLVASPILTSDYQVIPFARFLNTDSATNSLSRSGSTLTWSRGGAVPEVWRTTFEASTNRGASWIYLGAGTHITGGWQLTNVSLPANATVRARGYYTTGRFNGSSSIAEKIIGPPAMVSQPNHQTNYFGTSVQFFAAGDGDTPLSYQWRKSGANLIETADAIGTHTPLLTLSNIFGGRDAGEYTLVVSNSFGSVTSRVANLTVIEPIILAQPPTNQWALPGSTAQMNVTVGGTLPLNYQWRHNGTNLSGATQATLTINHAQATNAGTYDVVITNSFGSITSDFSGLTLSSQMPDSLLATNNISFYGYLERIAFQPDGRILVGGNFQSVSGQPFLNLARVGLDDNWDLTFHPDPDYQPNSGAGNVSAMAVQSDGKIIVGGFFTALGGMARTNIGRLNPDGSVDTTFNPGVRGSVAALAVQPDGKILVGGNFDRIAGQNRTNLARLNADGTLDPTVNSAPSVNVFALALASDGKILVGGRFEYVSGQPHTNIARFNADGSLDATFTASATDPFDYNNEVYSLAVQKDGKILVGGRFAELNGQDRRCLGRLNSDGSFDATFQPSDNNYVYALAIQADGKILPTGGNSIYRLEVDGTIDESFTVHVDPGAGGVSLAPDGKILLTGGIFRVNGQPREYLCRLLNDPAPQSLNPGASTVTWLRSGSCPEVWGTTFEYSTNGSSWVSLGSGTRIQGGWQASSVGLPANSTLRARGFVNGSGSQWFVEQSVPVGSELFPISGNPFTFQARVIPGQPLVIEASTNLVNWSAIHTNPPMATNLLHFTDPDSSQPRRFYRLRQ